MWVLTFVVMQAFNMHFFVLSKPAVTLTQSSGGSEDGCKYLHLWRNVPYVTQTSVVMSQLSNACSVFALEGYLLVTCCFASVHACVIGQTQRTQTWKNHCFYVTSPQNFGWNTGYGAFKVPAISSSDASILRTRLITRSICGSIRQRLASLDVGRWNRWNSERSNRQLSIGFNYLQGSYHSNGL